MIGVIKRLFKGKSKSYPVDGYYLQMVSKPFYVRNPYPVRGTNTYPVIRNIKDDSINFSLDNLEPMMDNDLDIVYLSVETTNYIQEFAENKYPLFLYKNILIIGDRLVKFSITKEDYRDVKLNTILDTK